METNLTNELQHQSDYSIEQNENKLFEDIYTGSENKLNKQESHKNEQCDAETTELLGSVTTGTRFSARVIQKMKQDQTRSTTPPPVDREQKKDEKNIQKTPSNIRANKPIWTNLERNYFFDAVNEFGKDFDAIGNFINLKLKRKSATDKTTHQVRQHYYQTYHKICKYVKFSDEVKKPVQELYALINYGEMRRRLQFVTDKHFMKLKNLVYQGSITVRCKGKNIRVKTPSCKALRRINQLDDTLEDIRLPAKIEVLLTPSNMETFGRLQTIAQNPRVRCMVPLHKKLVNFIRTFQYKWRSVESRLAEEESKLFSAELPTAQATCAESTIQHAILDPEMCFQPKNGIPIHRPLLSITDCLSNTNICLSAYEERLGVKVRSESLCHDRLGNKRQRTDSGSEKRSPDMKKFKPVQQDAAAAPSTDSLDSHDMSKENIIHLAKSESSSDELNDDILAELNLDNDILTTLMKDDIAAVATSSMHNGNPAVSHIAQHARFKRNAKTVRHHVAPTFKPLLNADAERRIRHGWTVSTAADITIGDLYVVLGHDSRLELEYYWTEKSPNEKLHSSIDHQATAGFLQKQSGMPYNPLECEDSDLLKTLSLSPIGNKLKHLLLIANLSERIRKRQCSCGHTCERYTAKSRIERDIAAKTFLSSKPSYAIQATADGNRPTVSRLADGGIFRQPTLPPRRSQYSMDPVRQLAALSGQKMSRQVFVQRLLLPGGTNQSHDVDMERIRHSESAETEKLKSTLKIATAENVVSTSATNEPLAATNIATNNDTVEKQTLNACSFAGRVDALSSPSNCTLDTLDTNSPASSTASSITQSMPTSTDSAIDDCSNSLSLFSGMSPMHLLRETNSNSRWLEDNLNDFSLTSLLGHLDEINTSRDIVEPSNMSVISESSVDYMHKFQEISALMQGQEKD